MSYLKRCPFCGGDVKLIRSSDGYYYVEHASVTGCQVYAVHINCRTEDGAATAWNRRVLNSSGINGRLKACPFCGGKVRMIQTQVNIFSFRHSGQADCRMEAVMAFSEGESDAINTWNIRPLKGVNM